MAESTNMDENDGRYQGILGTELPAVTDPRGLHGAPSPSAPRQGRLWNGRFRALDMDDDTHGDTLSTDLGFGIQEPSRKNMFASSIPQVIRGFPHENKPKHVEQIQVMT